ncbi:GntR family transcriptional regulator [Streptomyces sp. NPDC054884]
MNRRITAVTLTQSIQDHLKGLAHTGTLSPGDRLPPERELAASLGVTRVGLREAIRTGVDVRTSAVRTAVRGGGSGRLGRREPAAGGRPAAGERQRAPCVDKKLACSVERRGREACLSDEDRADAPSRYASAAVLAHSLRSEISRRFSTSTRSTNSRYGADGRWRWHGCCYAGTRTSGGPRR